MHDVKGKLVQLDSAALGVPYFHFRRIVHVTIGIRTPDNRNFWLLVLLTVNKAGKGEDRENAGDRFFHGKHVLLFAISIFPNHCHEKKILSLASPVLMAGRSKLFLAL